MKYFSHKEIPLVCSALVRLKAAYDFLNARNFSDDAIKPFIQEWVHFANFNKVL